ncbi:hypothetical protein PIB30_097799, partial [Stylosanthes scabra]|nr:hypothetical protein [Stylosanthes scabra]
QGRLFDRVAVHCIGRAPFRFGAACPSGGGQQGAGCRASVLPCALEEKLKKVEALTRSLEEKQMALDTAEATADHWRVDFSDITLDTRWEPKGQRIYNPKEETGECSEPLVEVQPE